MVTVDEYTPLLESLGKEGWFLLRLIEHHEVDLSIEEVSESPLEVDEMGKVRVTQRYEDIDIAVRSVGSQGAGAKEKREADVVLGPKCRAQARDDRPAPADVLALGQRDLELSGSWPARTEGALRHRPSEGALIYANVLSKQLQRAHVSIMSGSCVR